MATVSPLGMGSLMVWQTRIGRRPLRRLYLVEVMPLGLRVLMHPDNVGAGLTVRTDNPRINRMLARAMLGTGRVQDSGRAVPIPGCRRYFRLTVNQRPRLVWHYTARRDGWIPPPIDDMLNVEPWHKNSFTEAIRCRI